MTLRARFTEAVLGRVQELATGVTDTVWDASSIVCVIESLKFESEDGCAPGVMLLASFTGVLRVELHADKIDSFDFTPLIADLLKGVILLADFTGSELSEQACAVLFEQRDAVRDTQIVTALRFNITGALVEATTVGPNPDVYFSFAPLIGDGHEPDYEQMGGDA